MEFISRVKAVLRRSLKQEKDSLVFGEIFMDDKKRIVTVSGENCELTYKEYELLKYFMSNESMVLSREMIMDTYKIAVEQKYRFFSFGDAMLIK